MTKLSEERINKIKELRRDGLSFRDIEKRLGISYATAFYYGRDTQVNNHHPKVSVHIKKMVEAQRTEIKKKAQKMIGAVEGTAGIVREIDGTPLALVHLPYVIICPYCKKEGNHIWLCLECGGGLCTNCWEDIDLKIVPRKEELSLT